MRRLTLDYLKTESGAGLVLAAAAVAALGLANSRIQGDYFALVAAPVPVRIGPFAETLSLAGWVRAALMPIFFLVLGMELKFELLRGELSNPRRLGLPALAALGGLVAPALICFAVSRGDPSIWTAATPTDGAAALAALAVTGPRLAQPLRVLLMTVAIVDSLAATALTALLHVGALHWPMLAGAGGGLIALAALARWQRAPFLFYAALFVVIWGFTLKSGLDPALAGVAFAVGVPIGARRPGQESTLKYFMESLHGYVAFVVLPLFVATAVGVSVREFRLPDLGAPAPLGLMLGLALGKPLGVFGLCAVGVSLRWVRRPVGANWTDLLAVALFCGVGFTMSYFVAGMGLAATPAAVRAAILLGSILPTLAGGALLARAEASGAVRESLV